MTEALKLYPGLLLEVEVENLEQLEECCVAGAGRALLDNFSLRQLRTAAERYRGRIELEASGGVDLQSVRAVTPVLPAAAAFRDAGFRPDRKSA